MTVETAPQIPEDRFRWHDPEADRTTIHRLRSSLREWVSGLDRGAQFGDDVVLAAYEAAANAVEHGNQDAPGPVEVRAEYGRDGLELRVRDSGLWRDGVSRSAGRGNGLVLMRALSDECVVATDGAGTTVTMRWAPQTVRAAYRSVPGGR